jgi:hypothetical protein
VESPERNAAGTSVGERLQKRPIISLIIAVGAILGAAVVITQTLHTADRWWNNRWPEAEYARLDKLQVGVDVAQAVAILGSPLRTGPRDATSAKERIFSRHGYWVRVMSDSAETIQQLQVISCNSQFRPKFTPPEASGIATVQLGQSKAIDVSPNSLKPILNVPVSNGPSYTEETSGGHASGFIRYQFGWDSSCEGAGALPLWQDFGLPPLGLYCDVDDCQKFARSLDNYRKRVIVNAWGECYTMGSDRCDIFPGTVDLENLPLGK